MERLLAFLPYIVFINAGCPSGAVYNSDNNMCYMYNQDLRSFVDAESLCTKMNGHLASVHNAFLNSEIRSQANIFFFCTSHSDYWLGADTYLNSSWSWTDGTPWNYNNWAPGQPSTSASPQCVSATISDGRWYSSSCDVTKAYVCEIPEATPSCPSVPTQVNTDYVSVWQINFETYWNFPVPITSCPKPFPPCEDEWIHFSGTGFCYKIMHNMDYWSAESKCVSVGAHLTSIHSLLENDFIERITMTGLPTEIWTSYVWIGLNFQNGQWVWTDRTPFDYQRWAAYEPQTGYTIAKFVPDYPDASSVGTWYANDVVGDTQRAFVCKKKAAY